MDTDLSYFRYIVPCGLTKPVTSMRALGSSRDSRANGRSARRGTSQRCSNARYGDKYDRCRNAPDGRKYCRRNADQVAQESRASTWSATSRCLKSRPIKSTRKFPRPARESWRRFWWRKARPSASMPWWGAFRMEPTRAVPPPVEAQAAPASAAPASARSRPRRAPPPLPSPRTVAAVEETAGPLSPLVRKMARENNIDLSKVRGTGVGIAHYQARSGSLFESLSQPSVRRTSSTTFLRPCRSAASATISRARSHRNVPRRHVPPPPAGPRACTNGRSRSPRYASSP